MLLPGMFGDGSWTLHGSWQNFYLQCFDYTLIFLTNYLCWHKIRILSIQVIVVKWKLLMFKSHTQVQTVNTYILPPHLLVSQWIQTSQVLLHIKSKITCCSGSIVRTADIIPYSANCLVLGRKRGQMKAFGCRFSQCKAWELSKQNTCKK